MVAEQQKDPILDAVYHYVAKGIKPKPSAIAKIPSKTVRKYLLQFDWQFLKMDVPHDLYINSNVKLSISSASSDMSHYCAAVDPWWLWPSGLWSDLVSSPWEVLLEYNVLRCIWLCCQLLTLLIAKGHYVHLNTQPGSLIANKPIEFFCMDFIIIDPFWDGEENVLVLTDVSFKVPSNLCNI